MTVNEYNEEAERIRPKLVCIAARYAVDACEAEDAVQDTLLKLWQMCDALHLPIDRLACVLVRNRVIDICRRRRRMESIDMVTATVGDSEDARIDGMMHIIDTLPPLQQTVLRLRHMEGMEMNDIAEMMGCTEQAVRKTLSRARMAVRDRFYKTDKDER